jgi:small ligand-binding sensory domain FIST
MTQTRYPFAHALAGDWQGACDAALTALGAIPDDGRLGFVYAADRFAPDLGRIIERLRQRSGVETWVGTVGSGICSTGRETYEEPGLALMVTDIGPERYRLVPSIERDTSEFLASVAPWRQQTGAFFGVVHGDPRNPATPQLVEGLATGLENGYLVGGLSSAEGDDFPQVAGSVVSGGLSGALLGGDVPVATGLTQGCSLIGTKHEVTACERNLVISLDGRPALDVFKEDIGEVLARDLKRVAGYIFVAMPIAGSDTGDYLVRNLIGIDPESGLLAVGDMVQEGMSLQFARRDARTARDDLIRMLDGLKGRLDGPPKGALYHSCLGRGRFLFGEDSGELRLVREHLGDVPLVGFYANGEISHRRLYGYTGVLTLFL